MNAVRGFESCRNGASRPLSFPPCGQISKLSLSSHGVSLSLKRNTELQIIFKLFAVIRIIFNFLYFDTESKRDTAVGFEARNIDEDDQEA
jgi:hypothetical protein